MRDEDAVKVFHDGGGGVTAISRMHFAKYIRDIDPSIVTINHNGTFTFELFGYDKRSTDIQPVVLLESGFNCGYGGEGPHGSAEALELMGIPVELAEKVFGAKHLVYHVQNRTVEVE